MSVLYFEWSSTVILSEARNLSGGDVSLRSDMVEFADWRE